MKKYISLFEMLIAYTVLIGSWYLVAWFASPAFWRFLTQPVVGIVFCGIGIGASIWTLFSIILDV